VIDIGGGPGRYALSLAGYENFVNSLEGESFEFWANLNYRIAKDPAAIGASDHILYVGRKPGR
jgi:hypothetical protein